MAVPNPPPSPVPPLPSHQMLPSDGAASGVSWQWLKWFETLRQRVNHGASTGVDSINADTSQAQTIVGGAGVHVTTSHGTTTIAGTGTAGGILSINADAAAAQLLVAGTNIAIQDVGSGKHVINSTVVIPPATGIQSINSDTTANQTLSAGAGLSIFDNTVGDHKVSAEAVDINGPVVFQVNSASASYDTDFQVNASGGGGFTAGGDLSGTSSSQTVIGLEGKPLDATTVGAPSDGQVITYNAASGKYKALTPSGGGGGGMFAPIMSGVPTSAGTGFTTWVNQGATATVTDSAIGVALADLTSGGSGNNLRIRTKAVPVTPYSAIALFAFDLQLATTYSGAGFGWYDGSNKLHNLHIQWNAPGAVQYLVTRWSNPTTFSSADVSINNTLIYPYFWLKLKDDGTNVSIFYSISGVIWIPLYTVAKASGYLASYSNLELHVNPVTSAAGIVLMSYKETSP